MDLLKMFRAKTIENVFKDLRAAEAEAATLKKRLKDIPTEIRAEAFDEAVCDGLEGEEEKAKLQLRRLEGKLEHLKREYDRRRREQEASAAIDLAKNALAELDEPLERIAAAKAELATAKVLLAATAQRVHAAFVTAANRGRLDELPERGDVEARLRRARDALDSPNLPIELPRSSGPKEGDTRTVVGGSDTGPQIFRGGQWVAGEKAVQVRGVVHGGYGKQRGAAQ